MSTTHDPDTAHPEAHVTELEAASPQGARGDVEARPLEGRASLWKRWVAMARVGVRMMFHDKLKMIGTLFGVVFSVVLSNQQAGTFLGLLHKNTMYIENSGADLWIIPPGTQQLQPGQQLSDATLMQARVARGVAWAEPLLFAGGTVKLPSGGTEPVTIVGTRLPSMRGGPWNVVEPHPPAGAASADEARAQAAAVLSRPDTMFFEDSEREKLGGLNVGSVREVNGRTIHVGGFTWGLLPFGPSYAFANFDLVRELTHTDSDRLNFVLIGLQEGADVASVKAEIQRAVPEAEVVTRDEFKSRTIRYVLLRTPIGVTLGSSAAFGLIVGFVIVALTMFSAVVDNLREFGSLKAIGATTLDLAKALFVQSVIYAAMGTVIGLAAVTQMAAGIRSPKLALILPWQLFAGTAVFMVVLCVAASSLSLLRLRKLEPAMVFR